MILMIMRGFSNSRQTNITGFKKLFVKSPLNIFRPNSRISNNSVRPVDSGHDDLRKPLIHIGHRKI